MKPKISLKWFVALLFLSTGIVLVIGYTMLTAHYFILGMDNIIASNMERAARQNLPENTMKAQPAIELSGYFVSRNWHQQPLEVRKAFAQAPIESGVLVKRVESDGRGPPKNIVFAMRYEHEGNTLFVSRSIERKMVSDLVDRNVKQSRHTLLKISALSALALSLVI